MPEKKKRRQIEREFGVPVAGEILDPARWTQIALKKLPAEGPLDLQAVFGRRAPPGGGHPRRRRPGPVPRRGAY